MNTASRSERAQPVPGVVILAVALAFAFTLSALPVDAFKDRVNYLAYATVPIDIIQERLAFGIVSLLVNDPLWLAVNAALNTILPPDWTVRTIIFVPAFVVAWTVLHQAQTRWDFASSVVFLLSAQVLLNHIVHLRQGFAVAIFIFGWFWMSGKYRWPFVIAACFVHTSFVFVAAILAILEISRKFGFNAFVRIMLVVTAGLVVGFALEPIAGMIGARQVNIYAFAARNISGLGFVFWTAILLVFLSEGRSFAERNDLALSAIAFYLSTYFLVEVSARIFESTLLIVLLAGLKLSARRKQLFLLAISSYVILQYVMQLDEPLLGFGLS